MVRLPTPPSIRRQRSGGGKLRQNDMKSVRNVSRFLLVPLLLAVIGQARGAIYTAADCTLPNVQAAVAQAVAGDTVVLPAGGAYWTNILNINQGITLIGAGPGLTIITNGAWGAPSYESLINVQNTYPNFVRISGFSVTDSSATYADLNIGGMGQTSYFRVDHMQFLNISKSGITPNGWAVGDIDHCYFCSQTNGGATGVSITGEGAYSWDTRPPTWGDSNRVYIETCGFYWYAAAFNANGAVDSYNGARWCFRYNQVTNINVGCHGTDSSGSERSTHSYEVYNNNFYNETSSTYLALGGFRGGTGLFFSNTVTGHQYACIDVLNYRYSGTNVYGGTTPCCNPWGPVTGTNWLDGNQDTNGWPPYDSIGRTSPTIYYSNTVAPNGIATGYTVQASQPTYAWSNTCNGAACPITVGNVYVNVGAYAYIPPASTGIQENRDYFNDTPMPGYTPLVYPYPGVPPEPLLAPTSLHVVPPATPALVAQWQLADGAGTVAADSTPYHETGILMGNPSWQTSSTNTFIKLNGSGQYAYTPSAPVTNAPLTITCNFATTATVGLLCGEFASQQANWSSYYISLAGGKIAGYTANNNNFAGAMSPQAYNDGNWHFVAAVFGANQQILYVDGAPVQTNSGAQNPAVVDEFCIGGSMRKGSADTFLAGSVMDVRVYNYALTSDQIQQIYIAGPQ